MDQVPIVDPEGLADSAATPAITAAPRPGRLEGLRVGLLDNGKPNAREALAAMGEELSAEHGAELVAVTKPIASRPFPEDLL